MISINLLYLIKIKIKQRFNKLKFNQSTMVLENKNLKMLFKMLIEQKLQLLN